MDQDNAPTLALKPVEVIRYVATFKDENHVQHRPESGYRTKTQSGAEFAACVVSSERNGPSMSIDLVTGDTRASARVGCDLTAAEARTLAAQLLAGAELLEQLQGGAA